MGKIIVIGLDGAGFELLQPWIDQGLLPNIKKIQEEGCWADMQVCLPPVTCPNWKCYSTGKNPGNIGAFWWENIDVKQKKVHHPRTNYIQHKEIWDYLSADNKKVIVMNMPTTYPAKEVNGILISGGPDAHPLDFAYPTEIKEFLNSEGYKIHAEKLNPFLFSKEEILEDCTRVIKKRFDVFNKLLEKEEWDFAHLTIFHINALQHFYWNDDVTKKMWQMLDSEIGNLIKKHTIILMSDHGSNKIDVAFNINTWLEKNNYLKLKKPLVSRALLGLGIDQQKGYAVINKLGIKKDTLLKLIPKKLLEYIPFKESEFKKEAKTKQIDWKKSKALASGGQLYLIHKEKSYYTLRDELVKKIENLKSPSGKKIAKKVHFKESVYRGKFMNIAPDLIIDQNKGVHITGGIGKSDFFEKPNKWKGENKTVGLFMAYGDQITKKGKLEDVHILDLAPTILALAGLRIPNQCEGRIIYDCIKNKKEIENIRIKDNIRELKI